MDENPYKAPSSADKAWLVPSQSPRYLRLGLAVICYLIVALWVWTFFDWFAQRDISYSALSIVGVVSFACLGLGLQRNRKRLIYFGFALFLAIVVASLWREAPALIGEPRWRIG